MINWGPEWRALSQDDPEAFMAEVSEALTGDAWILDGNYRLALPFTLSRATDLIWLDYPRWFVMQRVIRRSLRRAVSGRELWPGTGNRESVLRWFTPDHPIRWAWRTHSDRRASFSALFSSLGAMPQRRRLKWPSEVRRLELELVARQRGADSI